MTSRNTFWDLIFQDHLFFIYDALGKEEVDLIETTKRMYNEFSNGNGNKKEALEFKKQLLSLIISENVDIKMEATFLNHILNEETAALSPPGNVLLIHKLWTNDIVGHDVTIIKMLDPVEKEICKMLKENKKTFCNLFLKTLEFIGYLRADPLTFSAADELTVKAAEETEIYLELITLILDGIQSKKTLGAIKPIMLDHMLREQSFYLEQIGKESELAVDYTRRGVDLPFHL